MCNLYRMKNSAAEVAGLFRVTAGLGANFGEEIYPGYPGLVVVDGAARAMTWGFPRPMKSKVTGQPIKPKPVNNIADLSSFMWRFVAPKPEHRCLIPLTGFCEAEGEKGCKTRTWIAVRDRPIFAWAGMWKDSHEWGPVYSGLMTDCNEAIRPVHDRMPVLLHEEDYDLWLHGSLEDVIAFQTRCFPDDLINIERTDEPWLRRRPVADAPAA